MGMTTQAADWRLEPISGADRDVVEIIGLPPEQEVSAGSLDEVFGRLNETDAVGLEQGFAVIEPGGEVVGFFVLREGLRRPPWHSLPKDGSDFLRFLLVAGKCVTRAKDLECEDWAALWWHTLNDGDHVGKSPCIEVTLCDSGKF